MPVTTFTKKFHIDVNSKELKAANKTMVEILKLEKELVALNKKKNDELSKQEDALKKRLSDLEKNKKLSEAEKRLQKEEIANAQLLIDKKRKFIELKERSNRLEQIAKRQEKLIEDQLELKEKARQAQRKKWEEGRSPLYKESFSSLVGRGITSFTKDKQFDIDTRLFELESKRLEQKSLIESLSLDPKQFTKGGAVRKNSALYKALTQKSETDKEIDAIKNMESKLTGGTKTALNYLNVSAKAVGKSISLLLSPFEALYKQTKQVVMAMIDLRSGVATYGIATSLITNTAAREQRMRYGLGAAQAYAFTQAKGLLNIQSDEDLLFMNPAQREKFMGYMQQYSDWYKKMESSGVLNNVQEMQLEFAELKQRLAMDFLQWIAANKDTIMYVVKGVFETIKKIADFVMKIASKWGGYQATSLSAYGSDYASYNNATTTSNKTVTIYANTTNNNSGSFASQNAFNAYSKENFEMLGKQIVEAIGG